MSRLAEKRILLGVTGGIAAYKACELTRQLIQAGACVRVVMTRAATAFVAPLTFQALSGNPVHLDLLDAGEGTVEAVIPLDSPIQLRGLDDAQGKPSCDGGAVPACQRRLSLQASPEIGRAHV